MQIANLKFKKQTTYFKEIIVAFSGENSGVPRVFLSEKNWKNTWKLITKPNTDTIFLKIFVLKNLRLHDEKRTPL